MRKVIDVIEDLEKSGDLQLLHKNGFIPSKILFYKEIYRYVSTKKSIGVPASTAVTWAEETFQCSRRTVYNALSAFD
ncbi:MAG: hypothetical protein QHC79_09460 [Pseudosphingobacterium sp.]|nr:hypothetical protein [Pseudosphingobacterium sp.]